MHSTDGPITKQDILDSEQRLVARLNQMEATILKTLQRIGRSTDARFTRLEKSEGSIVERLNALEERVLALEMPPRWRN